MMLKFRNAIIRFFYKNILRRCFFLFDPERVHDFHVKFGKMLGFTFVGRFFVSLLFNYRNDILKQKILGIDFFNPVGLGAGFDKNAELTQILSSVGFGFVEVGSITGEKCLGNQKPRLWRLKKSLSIVVNYGLKNDGAKVISARLRKLFASRKSDIPIFISIAKTNSKETAKDSAGVADYVKAYTSFDGVGDAFVINISCPNAYGGQPFTDELRLETLLDAMKIVRFPGKPMLLKLSPDMTDDQLKRLVIVAEKAGIDGYICSNLTKVRDNKIIKDSIVPSVGGLSGALLRDKSDSVIEKIFILTKGKKLIIGLGGIFNAEQAYRKIKKGASLVQIVTGMIFEGPQIISDINMGIVDLLRKDGFSSITEAIGIDVGKVNLP